MLGIQIGVFPVLDLQCETDRHSVILICLLSITEYVFYCDTSTGHLAVGGLNAHIRKLKMMAGLKLMVGKKMPNWVVICDL
jgi:hypothetical protein